MFVSRANSKGVLASTVKSFMPSELIFINYFAKQEFCVNIAKCKGLQLSLLVLKHSKVGCLAIALATSHNYLLIAI